MDQMKKHHQPNRFIFYYIIVSANSIQIGSLVTEIQNSRKDVRLFLYNIYSLRKKSMTNIKKNSSTTQFNCFTVCLDNKFCWNRFTV